MFLRIDRATFSHWLAEGCPGDSVNRVYDLSEIVAWARENKWSDGDAALAERVGNDDLTETLLRRKIEKLEEDIRLQRGKADEQAESLVNREEIEEMLRRHSSRLRSGLDTLQRKELISGRDAYALIAGILDQIERDLDEKGDV